MPEKPNLEQMRDKLGIPPEQKKATGPGRPVGSKGRWPDKKKMTKDDLIKEAGQNRKLIQDLEAEIQKHKAGKEAALEQISPEMWAMIPVMVYDFMSFRFGDHWKLKEQEAMIYGEQLGLVANRYLGEVAGDKPELVGLIIVAGIITVPRAVMTIKLRLSKPQEPAQEEKPEPDPERTKEKKSEGKKRGSKTDGGNHGPGTKGIG